MRAPDGSLALRPVTPDDLATHGLGLLALDAARMFGAHRGRPDPRLRVGDLQRALLRPLAGSGPPLVLAEWLRERGEGAPAPPAPA